MSRVQPSIRVPHANGKEGSRGDVHFTNPECPQTPWRSIYIAAGICFFMSAQFSLFFSSLWPYMQVLEPTITENFFGYIVAAYSLGQLVGSPLVGFWSNRVKNVRHPLMACLALSLTANLIYISAAFTNHSRKYVVLVSRLALGLGASGIGILRSYAATASTKEDRTRAIAFVTGGFALGMSSGPAIQLAFIPIGYPGLVITGRLTISMYNMPAITGCVMNLLGMSLVIFCFLESYAGIVNKVEVQENGEVHKVKLPPFDRIAVITCYITRFTQMFTYTNLETVGAPLVMISYAFTKTQTVKYLAIAHTGMSGLAFCVYMSFIVFKLEKFINFRRHVIISLSGLILFHLITFPWPFNAGRVRTYTDEDVRNSLSTNGSEPVGCNLSRLSWCPNVHPVNVWVYFVSFALFIGV